MNNLSQVFQKQLFYLTEQIIKSITELVKQYGKEKLDETDFLGLFLPIKGFDFPLISKFGYYNTPEIVSITHLWLMDDNLLMTDCNRAIYFPCELYNYEPIQMALNLPPGCGDIWPCKMTVEQMLLALKQAEESANKISSSKNENP